MVECAAVLSGLGRGFLWGSVELFLQRRRTAPVILIVGGKSLEEAVIEFEQRAATSVVADISYCYYWLVRALGCRGYTGQPLGRAYFFRVCGCLRILVHATAVSKVRATSSVASIDSWQSYCGLLEPSASEALPTM